MLGRVRDNILILFKTNTTNDDQNASTICMEVKRNQGKKNKKKSEDNVKNILFILKIENRAIKDRIIRDIRNMKTFFEQEEDYYKPVKVGNF